MDNSNYDDDDTVNEAVDNLTVMLALSDGQYTPVPRTPYNIEAAIKILLAEHFDLVGNDKLIPRLIAFNDSI